MIAHQGACHFDVATLQCGEPTAPAACLTAEQVKTVKDVTSDIKLADDTTVYSGYTWADWYPHVVAFGMLGGGNVVLATGDLTWFSQTSKQQSFWMMFTRFSNIVSASWAPRPIKARWRPLWRQAVN